MGKPQSNSKQDYGWFGRFVINILQRYAHQASADRIFKKYAGLPKDVIAARYIAVQARVALLAGAVSALIVSTAQLAAGAAALGEVALPVIATPVAVSTLLITVPTILLVFAGEMAFTTRLQVRTAYDLCLLCRLKKLKERAKIFYVRPRGLACRIVALIIGIGVLLLSCACLVTTIFLVQSAIGQ